MQVSAQTGLLMLLLGVILIMGGTIISMLLGIYRKLELIPKAGYVFTCAAIYVVGSLFTGFGIVVIVVAIPSLISPIFYS